MNILNLLSSIKFSYASYTALLESQNDTNVMCSITSVDLKASKERDTFNMKKIIATIFAEEDIAKRISIIEKKYDDNLLVTQKYIESSICWNSVFTDEKECEIRRDAVNNGLIDDFIIRLYIIIEEMHGELFRYFFYNSDNEFYSLEMINNLYFIKELHLEYFIEFEYEIIKIILQFFHVHYLKSVGLRGGRTKDKILGMIATIRKNIKELRKLIAPKSKSLLVINDIISEMPDINLPIVEIYIRNDSRSFILRNVINCKPSTNFSSGEHKVYRKVPYMIFNDSKYYINMQEIYDTLENYKNDWKSGVYTEFECVILYMMYSINIAYEYPGIISENLDFFDSYLEYIEDLLSKQRCKGTRLLSFIFELLPCGYVEAKMWYSRNHNRFSKICHRKFMKVIDFRKILKPENKTNFAVDYSDLLPIDQLEIFKAVIDFYDAYISYKVDELQETGNILTHDYEALINISRSILHHLKATDVVSFDKYVEKYVNLFIALEKLTSSIIEGNIYTKSTVFIDYPHLLEFYEEYILTGLRINCIYNIGFLYGKSTTGILLTLDLGDSVDVEEYHFYKVAGVYIESIRNQKYDMFQHDDDTYETLEHIVKSIIETNAGNFDSRLLEYHITRSACEIYCNSSISNSDIRLQLNAILKHFWPNIYFYTSIFKTREEEQYRKYSIKKLYDAKYITDKCINNLYDACCTILNQGVKKDVGLLKLGIKTRRNKKLGNKVLYDMIFNLFESVQSTICKCEYDKEVFEIIQFLFRSLNYRYLMDISKKIVYEIIAHDNAIKNKQMYLLVQDLGIYSLLPDVKIQYLSFLKSYKTVENCLSINEYISDVNKSVYELLYEFCNDIDNYIQTSISELNIPTIWRFSTELETLIEAYESANNDILRTYVLLTFVITIIKTTHIHSNKGIRDIIRNLIKNVCAIINCPNKPVPRCGALRDTKLIFFMISFILEKKEKIQKTTSTDFISTSCTVLDELAYSYKTTRRIDHLYVSIYKNQRDRFISITDLLDGHEKLVILSYMIYCNASHNITGGNLNNTFKLIDILSSVFRHKSDSEIEYPVFIQATYVILKKFVHKLDEEGENYSLLQNQAFSEICVLLQQYNNLVESIGYKLVPEADENNNCYICTENIFGKSAKPLNCVCISAIADLLCLLKYRCTNSDDGSIYTSTPVCCICKK